MTTQHTQCPWLVNCDDGQGISIIGHPTADIHRAAKGSQHLATVVYDDKAQADYLPHTPSHETAKANAHLIAAAPDMLNAIEQAAADIEDFLNYQEQQGDPMDDQFTGTLRMLKRVSERARGQQE